MLAQSVSKNAAVQGSASAFRQRHRQTQQHISVWGWQAAAEVMKKPPKMSDSSMLHSLTSAALSANGRSLKLSANNKALPQQHRVSLTFAPLSAMALMYCSSFSSSDLNAFKLQQQQQEQVNRLQGIQAD
jgi:hypothetical protein